MKKIIALAILTLASLAGTAAAQAAMDSCREADSLKESYVHGKVRDSLNRPIASAKVTIEHYDNSGNLTSVRLSVNPEDGTYRWTLPSCGYVRVSVHSGRKQMPPGYWSTGHEERSSVDNDFVGFEVRYLMFVYVLTPQ